MKATMIVEKGWMAMRGVGHTNFSPSRHRFSTAGRLTLRSTENLEDASKIAVNLINVCGACVSLWISINIITCTAFEGYQRKNVRSV